MKLAQVNGVTLEYEVVGAGEPLLLISPVLADGFFPLVSEPALAERYRMIRYHKRGWLGSTHPPGPASVADHVADAAALLDHLGIQRAHIAGHSSGGVVALQLALDHASVVQTLCLLEPTILSVPSGAGFFEAAKPAFDAYAAGRHEEAFASFMPVATDLAWDACRAVLEKSVPGIIAQAVADADTFFGVELPGVAAWEFDAAAAARISQPALSVVGAQSGTLWVEVAERLRSWLPAVEECTIDGVAHLLHIQQSAPVARAIAAFLRRHPIAGKVPTARPAAAVHRSI
jgi:pimeloyl-ACP methyl ester carboxylesterase